MDWLEIILPIAKSIALALIVLLVGLAVIRVITKFVAKGIDRSKMDDTLKPFLTSMAGTILKILLVLTVVQILGVDITSFVAIIAAAGFAIGLAFQGSLANFAGGVLLLTLRPIRVGDYVEGGGYAGTVQGIKILYTELVTPDNKVIFVPNASLSNTGLTNYNVKDTRRVDFTFGAGYETSADYVIQSLTEIVSKHPLVFQDPAPFVRISEHGESAVVYTVRVWSKSEDYWTVHFDVMEDVKKWFENDELSIPYPQMDVNVSQKQ
ncbi:mechanosensitive ion channel MscS [Salimicrobium jeotgali]|uniref:Mechanosensitive ion channel MscS n=1 Tax=Salimicrobium jeotgali TaxID=1230341 RepID=K2GAA9_9BACI|nr:mechanosensitive ion channel domain-containing protein [Salimicrobium jeotgali]EKE31277.1 mechanosensitive ion channel MscS [Salimicrobium jeotgali]MBM7697089.1 small conductance mechanosensitive channel [Salimicrobium jeotgali]